MQSCSKKHLTIRENMIHFQKSTWMFKNNNNNNNRGKKKSYLLKTKYKICPFYIPSDQQIGPSKKRCNPSLKNLSNDEWVISIEL